MRTATSPNAHDNIGKSGHNLSGVPGAVGLIGLTAALLACQTAAAITVTPLGKGQLPSGDFIVMTQLTLNPGESVGWHYHPGTGLRVVLSGALTEDEGCGNPLITHAAGSAFQEDPGHVHRIFNLGSEPVVVLRTDILPPCYVTQGTIFVSGPDCEGDSGRSHLQPVAPCSADASKGRHPERVLCPRSPQGGTCQRASWRQVDGSRHSVETVCGVC
jgi:quercetin dioxygenase-like cupin family protein